ncbi:MAG TPA: hypothetical protein DCE44_06520 [Verrucomicrobiales bacterium]|nr:hypothetical protein [Verrucomicrobiales bacterium]
MIRVRLSHCFSAWLTGAVVLAAPAPDRVQFNRDIRPILSDNCFACHGFDAKHRKAGLRLDVAEGAFSPNKDGVIAIKPGNLAGSELWKRLLATDPDDVMPPPESHKTLTPEQKELIKRWIEQGAAYQKHWAFEPVVDPPVPNVPSTSPKARNPIDVFLADRLKKEGYHLATEADRPTLIRRLSFDLRGLPPTVAEVDAFLADSQPGAYERLVDRFLDSPEYGEHMGKHWLDVARYADTHGLHLDNERQTWAYRDWVVQSFNRNLPYDQFTIEQLAGDLLPNPTPDQLVATGFNRCNVTTSEGGAIDAEFLFRYAVDRTATTVQTWLGLTAGCAVCHDHKFDPLSHKEFYSLYAFFYSAADPAMDGNALRTAPMLQLKSSDDEQELAKFKERIETAEAKIVAGLQTVSYTDPASLNPPPAAREEEIVWLDDDVPSGFKPQAGPNLVTAENGKVFSGKRALRREDTGVGQDVFESDGPKLTIPDNARLFAHVFIEPANPPKAVMLQFNRDGWEHRAIWGDADAIGWGEKGKPSRAHLGDLPKTGEWVRLEVPAEAVGLKAGDQLRGLAYTQSGGTVFWDKSGVLGRTDPANDPRHSFAVWTQKNDGQEEKGFPENIRKIFKDTGTTNRTPEQVKQLRDYYLSQICLVTKPTFDPLNQAVAELRKQRDAFNDAIIQTFVFRDLEKPRDSFVMMRGAYDKPGEKVEPGVPAVLPPLRRNGAVAASGGANRASSEEAVATTAANSDTLPRANRLDLARWLMDPENPLTARVAVNRFWQQLFGIGLVKSSGDFGSQGQPPSHPELLDWLATTFQESGWDIKGLIRLMVTSSAYRQSSTVAPELLNRDPENRLLARGPRFRLDAEQLRDNALFVSGLLDSTMGGKGVKPYQPPNIWEPVGFVGSNTREYKQDTGSALYRRSMYTFFKRTAPAPFLSTFDAPNREQSCSRRERSNTPLQALQLMNDVQHFEAARALAERMLVEGGSTPQERLTFGYRTVLARLPSTDELAIVSKALNQHLARYSADAEAAKLVITVGESRPTAQLAAPELAAYTLTANLLLNLDETVTRN